MTLKFKQDKKNKGVYKVSIRLLSDVKVQTLQYWMRRSKGVGP